MRISGVMSWKHTFLAATQLASLGQIFMTSPSWRFSKIWESLIRYEYDVSQRMVQWITYSLNIRMGIGVG